MAGRRGCGARPKRSRIWKLPDEQFIALAKDSETITDLCCRLGVGGKVGGAYGSGYWAVKERCEAMGLWDGLQERKYKKRSEFLKPVDELGSRAALRQRIQTDGLLPYECAGCGNRGLWNGRGLSLQLHHKNGVASDHRLDNVEYLCPNCHSQTSTWTGRNAKRA